MRLQNSILSALFFLFLVSCDVHQTKAQLIEAQTKIINCTLNGSPLGIEISKGSLNANFIFEGKKELVNLLKFQDNYQILMKYEAQIGQLKINQAGTELTQLLNKKEIRTTCKTIIRG